MIRGFVHEDRPGRVVFAAGARHRLAAEVATPLGGRVAELHPHAAMHVPVAVAEQALARSREIDAGGCLAVGGGSAIGLAKAIAAQTGLPIVALPTTYAGSEMTSIWGLSDAGGKRTGRDPKVRPGTVVYDPELTVTLPVRQSVTSGMNALAHSAEALYAPDRSPITALVAAESVRAIADALPRVHADPRNLEARADALYGAWLAGTALGSTTMSLHHQLCHLLGGLFDMPHAETHTAVLPHVLALNLPAVPEARTALRSALGAADPARYLFCTARRLGAEMSLRALGLPDDGLDAVVERALAALYANPVHVTELDLRRLLGNALVGAEPA